MASSSEHEAFRLESERLYLTERDAKSDALDWKNALWEARREIIAFLRASDFLCDVAGALEASGSHSIPMRHFLAPPVSQDQFRLICPSWSKSIENSGRGFKAHNAAAIAAVFEERRSKRLTAWVDRARAPRTDEVTGAIGAIAPLMASEASRVFRRRFHLSHATISRLSMAA